MQDNYSSIIWLTQGKYAIVDHDDYEEISQSRWNYNSRFYAVRQVNYITVGMHRVINKTPQHLIVDHINGNKLDNRKANLRDCTHKENGMNTKLRSTNKSGFKGVHNVSYKNKINSYCAQARDNLGKRVYLGNFKTPQEAAAAYDECVSKYFGNYAMTNKLMGLI